MPSIYNTPTGFVIALLLKAWWTESLTVQITSLHKERRASCCDGSGVTSSPGTALLLCGYSLQLPGPAASTGSFHLYPGSQGFAITSFHHPAMSLQQCRVQWVWQLPQSCPLVHLAVPLLSGQAKLQAFPPAPAVSWLPCLPYTTLSPTTLWVQQSTLAPLK